MAAAGSGLVNSGAADLRMIFRGASGVDATLACEPIDGFLLDMVDAGGLLPQLKKRLENR